MRIGRSYTCGSGNALAHILFRDDICPDWRKDKALIEYDRVIALFASSTLATNANIGKTI